LSTEAKRRPWLQDAWLWVLLVGPLVAPLFVALGRVAGEDVAYFALIPASVGVALLIFYIVEGRKGAVGKDVSPSSPP